MTMGITMTTGMGTTITTLTTEDLAMEAVFDAYVMVDWSAESRPKTGPDSIWWACLERVGGAVVERAVSNPPTRAQAVAELADLLSDLSARGLTVLAGFDFCFGFPAGFAEKIGAADWRGTWRRIAAEVMDGPDNANDRFQAAARLNQRVGDGPGPFWGCPKASASPALAATKPDSFAFAEKRLTEQRLPMTKPVWQMAYAGNVGSQTLVGIPCAWELRRHPWLAEATRVWPFETGLVPLEKCSGWRILMAEIYPSMVPAASAEGEVKDCAQMLALARHFAALDAKGRLGELFAGDPGLSKAERRIAEREEGWILGAAAPVQVDLHAWVKDPAAIYRESFATIRREIDVDALSPALADVVVRIVHACGMTEIVADMAWSDGAAEAGRAALAAGAPILVDAQMVAHGIIGRRLPKANRVICTLNEPSVAGMAITLGTTRSAMAVELWRPHLDGAIVAIGNAPTALFRLLEMIKEGAPRPALVLGFSVGFIGAAESKDALIQSGLPFIALRGRRGGSAMAAAAVNALAGENEA